MKILSFGQKKTLDGCDISQALRIFIKPMLRRIIIYIFADEQLPHDFHNTGDLKLHQDRLY